jgi:hypothetical protein
VGLADEGSNPLAQQRAHILGLAPAPRWYLGEMLLARWAGSSHCEGGVYLAEEDTTHPEQVPLLALRQVDDEGLVCGEVWLRPADLPRLIAGLTQQFEWCYSTPSRRWRELPDGPLINLGDPDPEAAL